MVKQIEMPPKEKNIIAPAGGWEPSTFYVVDVAFNSTNVVHRSIFYSGFCHHGIPAGYNQIFNPSYEENIPFNKVHYMKAVKRLFDRDELETLNG
jgi:hypothetical protein